MILDAFALGSLPELAGELGPWAGRLILTPNITEAGILLGHDAGELAPARCRSSRRSTARW